MNKLARAGLALCLQGLTILAANAQAPKPPSTVAECSELKNDVKRLACYDMVVTGKPIEEPKKPGANGPDSDEPITWKVRDSGTVSPVGYADIGTKAALFQVGRSDGKSFTAAKASVVGLIKPINKPDSYFNTWTPFVGLAWERDTAAKTPKDQRQLIGGITGNLFSVQPGGTGVLTTYRLGHRDDVKARTKSDFVNAHADIYHLPWIEGDQGEGINFFAPLPYVGALVQRNRSEVTNAESDGRRTGLYGGIKMEVQLYKFAPRLSAQVATQWFRDVNVSDGKEKRRERFSSIGFKYDLVDPKATKGWVPSLQLTWQRGSDPVTGDGPVRKTVLGLGVKFD